MIITRLTGGLGNQMFQYALGRVLSIKHAVSLGLDTSLLGKKSTFNNDTVREFGLGDFAIQADIVPVAKIPFVYRINNPLFARIYDLTIGRWQSKNGVEKKHGFDPSMLRLGSNVFLSGFWQSYAYFSGPENDYEKYIRADFRLREEVPETIQKIAEAARVKNTLCVHVRRTDYVGTVHDVVAADYYHAALSRIEQELPPGQKIETIYIFSDDIDWCRQHVSFAYDTVYVDQHKDVYDMYIMSQCKHFIIANSTFSWWAAWLAEYPGKIVIAPKYWFAHTKSSDLSTKSSVDIPTDTPTLTPPTWIRM
ncbi:alpha-1,2-fucosyltransferase [Candidatus Woesebacteria bacterium]|nr:alpha-1,2-fucosyltransferase [Candidatus Woesebacteria bacterium]